MSVNYENTMQIGEINVSNIVHWSQSEQDCLVSKYSDFDSGSKDASPISLPEDINDNAVGNSISGELIVSHNVQDYRSSETCSNQLY